MATARIYTRDKPGMPKELWAQRTGTMKEIRRSAEELLREMREDLGLTRARVFIDGKGITIGRKS